jgi:hypothetical protein
MKKEVLNTMSFVRNFRQSLKGMDGEMRDGEVDFRQGLRGEYKLKNKQMNPKICKRFSVFYLILFQYVLQNDLRFLE